MRDRPGGEAEIGFRLAAAGREEQQIDDLAIVVRRVLQAGEVEQDEGELERPPARRCVAPPDRRRGRPRAVARRARTASFIARKARRAYGSLRKKRDAGGDAVARLPRGVDQALRVSLAAVRRGLRAIACFLLRDPGLVQLWQGGERVGAARRGRSAASVGQRLHVEIQRLSIFSFGSTRSTSAAGRKSV